MAESKRRIPKYRHYKPKNLAVVRINGKDHYLGEYNSDGSWEQYHRLIAEWLGNGYKLPSPPRESTHPLSIVGMIDAYRQFAEEHYKRSGKPTKELAGMKAAVKPLRKLFGSTPAANFGPKSLKAVRQQAVRDATV